MNDEGIPMAKLLYSVTMSLDGFIAGAGGDMSWLKEHIGGPNPVAAGIVARIGALLVGNRSHRGDDPNRGTDKEGAFQGAWHGPTIVLTHHVPAVPEPGITYAGDLAEALAKATEAAGDSYVNILGANVAKQVLEAGRLDEILVFIAPVLLGDGTRLFEHAGGTNVRLERIAETCAPDPTSMWLRVVR
jgi:dihydrofolate reductase